MSAESQSTEMTRITIEFHAGNEVAGNVGKETRKQFSITVNPVIIASRIEQLNKEYKSQMITEEVFENLDDYPAWFIMY